MNSRFLLFALILLLSGCGTNVEKYKPVIEAEILRNSAGMDIRPKVDSLVLINKYSAEEVANYWIAKEGCGGNIDTLINYLKNINMDSSNGQYKWFKWEQNRVRELKAADEDEVFYEVVKAWYTIELPAKKTKSSDLLYYFIQNGQVVGTTSEVDLKNALKHGGNPIFAYEYLQFKFETPELP